MHPDRVAEVIDRAIDAARERGLPVRTLAYGRVNSIQEAAEACGVAVIDVVKTLVVRRSDDDHVLVLVPGDRSLSWKKLRSVLGVSRISLPDAEQARQVTGYERGTITPLGVDLPVVADERICGRHITLGSGVHGRAIAVDADSLIHAYRAMVADVTDDSASPPAPARPA
jgi:Cys-tRNA(Pro)/Cys-tRNA(Cys) deacylase